VGIIARVHVASPPGGSPGGAALNVTLYLLPIGGDPQVPLDASPAGPRPPVVATSNGGIYETETAVLEARLANGRRYVLVPSTFDPVEVEFVLEVYSFPRCDIRQVQ